MLIRDPISRHMASSAAFDVRFLVAEQVGFARVDIVFRDGIQYHLRRRFPAGTPVLGAVGAHQDVVQDDTLFLQSLPHRTVECFGLTLGEIPAGDTGLIGHNDQQITGLSEQTERLDDSG